MVVDPRIDRCIALVGCRAAGKSTLGARLATRLRRPFFDLDREIEVVQGRSIRRLFQEEGEAFFREIEAETLEGILARPGIVLAPGGGIVERMDNRTLLRSSAFVVHLDVEVEELIDRLQAGLPAAGGRESGAVAEQRPPLTELGLVDETRTIALRRASLFRECAASTLAVSRGEAIESTHERLVRLVIANGASVPT